MKRAVALTTLLAALLVPALPGSAAPRPDADNFEAYFPMGDTLQTTLHADVLRPKGMPLTTKTPVILTVSPYLNHGGVPTNDPAAGHVTGQGPSARFYDFLDLSQILSKGYTYVMVDLPGFGGSSGCNDWGGLREQQAVKAAVEWSASQPWSNGKVGLIGKSYDAWTGLMGIAQQPAGLAAVVSMEPVYSGYDYLYMNGVRFLNSLLTPALFQAFDAQPGTINDTPQYHANGAPQVWCYGVNWSLQQQDDPTSTFWTERDLQPQLRGEKTPLFLTQGFLESNTKPDGAFDAWNGLAGTENRAWFGQFDHVRGWEKSGARFHMGRTVFVEEMMRFWDEHLKGIAPAVQDPTVAVQDNRGRYRAESQWPPEDMTVRWSELKTGTYADGPSLTGSSPVWTVSKALNHDVWLSGEPEVKIRVETTVPRANLVADVFDIAPDGEADLISRGAFLLRAAGEQVANFKLYGQDWRLPAGHRIGIVIAGTDQASSGWWVHAPTSTSVQVLSARIGLPFLYWERDPDEYLDGGSTPRLEQHLAGGIDISGALIAAAEKDLDLPGPLVERQSSSSSAPLLASRG